MQKEKNYALFVISICLVGASIIKYSIRALWKVCLGELCSRIETILAHKMHVYTKVCVQTQCVLKEQNKNTLMNIENGSWF